jgi:ferredoxin
VIDPECFRQGEQMLFIDPVECIDCDACVSECPVEAIYFEDDAPDEWKSYIALNAEMATKCPQIVERQEPLSDCRKRC